MLKVRHTTEVYTQNGLTIAERDKIDEVISAMNKAQQKRALKNIDPDLILEAANEQLQYYAAFVKDMNEITIKYQNKNWDLLTLWKQTKEYEQKMKEARYRK